MFPGPEYRRIPVIANKKRGTMRVLNSRTKINGVQGVAGSNPAVPTQPTFGPVVNSAAGPSCPTLRRHLSLPPTLARNLFREKHLHQRLVWHVPFVGQGLELLEQRDRQTNRDSRRGRSEVWQGGSNRPAPVEVVGSVVPCPEPALLILVREARQRLPSRSLSLAHRSSVLVDSYPAPRGLGSESP